MIEAFRKNKDKFFFYCLALSIVSLPFSLKLNSISIIILFIYWILKDGLKEKLGNITSPLFYLFISLYFFHVIGMLWTSNIEHGKFELEKKLSLLIFPIIIGTSKKISFDEIKKILNYFACSCTIVSLICLAYAFYRAMSSGNFYEINPVSNYATHYFFYEGLSEIFIHPIYFSAFISFSAFVVLKNILKLHDYFSRKNILHFIWLAYLIVFLFLLSSRTMTISFFLISAFYILYFFLKNKKIFLGISITSVMIAIFISSIIFIPTIHERFSEIFTSSYSFNNNPETNKNLSGKLDDIQMRFAKWFFTIKTGKKTWILGTGTGDDEDELMKTYLENNFMEGYVPQYNSHNQFLQTWLGLGVIGLGILLLNLLASFYLSLKRKNIIYFFFIFLITAFCFTESILCRQHGVVFYSFFNSLFAFHFFKDK
ncbi:MAG: O-antigen ligase family protein [Bacteroidetes bacterium]|nr:O-antigen ligase family protein [Bacteroidota bacterium]